MYNSIFIEGSVHYYLVPELFSGLIEPNPGFRAALGYELNNFRFGVESGYTHILGTNPLVLDFELIPLKLKAGYNLPLRWGLGVQADIGVGLMFSSVKHYTTAINMLMGNMNNSQSKSFMATARLYGTYTLPGSLSFIRLYAGGGADMLFEDDGLIPLPVLEAGISLKPLALIRAKAKSPVESQIELRAEIPETVVEILTETAEVKTETEQPIRFFSTVYFHMDSAEIISQYFSVLDEAGERLKNNPSLRITLKGYTAPFGSERGRVTISRERAVFCADYLERNYSIEETRITVEYYGAQRAPESNSAGWESYRCVELIIEQE